MAQDIIVSAFLRNLGCVLFVLALFGCSSGEQKPKTAGARGGSAAAKKAAQTGPRPVEVARSEPTTFTRTLRLGGTVTARNHVQVASRVEGVVTHVLVDLGDEVRAGQTLARVSPEDFRARVTELDAQLTQAVAEVGRLERLQGANLATEQALEAARTKVSVLQAQRTLGARQLRDTTITAPFAGAILARHVSRGAYVRAGTPLFDLVSADQTMIALDVPERYVGSLREGTVVRIARENEGSTFDAGSTTGRIVRLAPAVTVATRTLRVEAELDDGSAMRPGMFAIVTIDLGTTPGVVRVPASAVFTTLGETRVVRIDQGIARPVRVEHLGDQEGYAVIEGIEPSVPVVIRNPGVIPDGAAVSFEGAT